MLNMCYVYLRVRGQHSHHLPFMCHKITLDNRPVLEILLGLSVSRIHKNNDNLSFIYLTRINNWRRNRHWCLRFHGDHWRFYWFRCGSQLGNSLPSGLQCWPQKMLKHKVLNQIPHLPHALYLHTLRYHLVTKQPHLNIILS